MALSVHDPYQAGRRGRRARRSALSEINVTPLVDVMLVLLIIFMISAPLLTVGVPLQLPKTEAGAMQDQNEPLTVSIRADGSVFLNRDSGAVQRAVAGAARHGRGRDDAADLRAGRRTGVLCRRRPGDGGGLGVRASATST